MLLSDKYPFLTEFFETVVHSPKKTIPQSILFYGSDFEAQYTLANEIARFANCTGDKTDDCQCLNCKWIRENNHPAVLTVSRLDNKQEDDSSKTVISVKQSEMIRNSLITSSDYHRFYIFCDRDDDGNIKGLNKFNFQEPVANSLLKSIEEPSSKVTFIFLTRDKEDLISTIISRSQCFFVPSKKRVVYNCDAVEQIFEKYWELKRSEAFNLSDSLCKLADEKGAVNILEQVQYYILKVLKSNPKSRFLIDDIKTIEKAKTEALVGMRNDIVFDELCLKIIH